MAAVRLTQEQVTLLKWALSAMYRTGVVHTERLMEKDLTAAERALLLDKAQEEQLSQELKRLGERWKLEVLEERDATCP